ncbi:hypothetical protein KAFR_0A07810 [Kazachstania africana CBS 2517]|uniref:Uncharacterized protein n=1 Tax=Kazachstania africana (strain ATCC 22294 / BCRC 22015 / CBS 2517 / CECT 1963 / NBRC 1671 / NRRL Y-8276) TaxID=1071382 RepID=H2APB5_KAZAF|nr:hypothetical protein KAFR_0A07810 [Kazachstania africana CBS 2517]CCF56215.1 hypothetical protein KAFR_0A07810 [Kazachstania africana CBS 2517]
MRRPPRSLEEWLYYKLINSVEFNRFVTRIHHKINGIKDTPQFNAKPQISPLLYKPSKFQKINAFRILFWDELKGTLGFKRTANKFFKD